MAIKEYNVDLDIKGRVLATTVPNSTGSIVTWNANTNVFGLRTNAEIISDLNLSSNFVTTNTNQTGLSGNKTTSGIWNYSGSDTTRIISERTSSDVNNSMLFRNGSGNTIYIGQGSSNLFVIAGTNVLSTVSNRWMWVDSSGLVSSQNGFSKTGATNNDMLLAGGGHRPVSDFALASDLGDLPSLTTTNKNNLVDAINEVNGNTNNIEIGGRNLLLSSSPIVYWEGVHTVESSSGAFVYIENYEKGLLYQIEARTNDPNLIGKEFGWQFSSSLQGKSVILTNQWQKAYCIVPLDFTGALGLRVLNGTGVLELRKMKAEKGNIPTDWTPAIEDQVSDWNETDSTKYSFIKNKPNITGFIPYTGANQAIDFNTQNFTHNGLQRRGSSSLTQTTKAVYSQLRRVGFGTGNIRETNILTHPISFGSFSTLSGQFLAIKFPPGTFWPNPQNVTFRGYIIKSGSDERAIDFSLTYSSGPTSSNGLVLSVGNIDFFNTFNVVSITTYNSERYLLFGDGSVDIPPFQLVVNEILNGRIGNQAIYEGEWTYTLESNLSQFSITDNNKCNINNRSYYGDGNDYVPINGVTTINNTKTFTSSPIVPNATLNGHAVNLGQLNTILGDYATEDWVTQEINNISIPTVNDGQLSLTTGTGLSGSANFTANQSGNSSFDVGIASTHKLPTITEWNALPTTNTITRLRGTASGTFTSGDLTLLAGTGIGITQSGANITITNSSPNVIQTLSQTGQVVTLSNGGGSFTLPTPNAGTVTSVAMTTPTGLTVTGSPITSNGTLALGYATGYQGYTTAEADKLAGLSNYVLPTASATVLGGIKVGSNLTIDSNGVLSATNTNTTYTAGTGLSLTGTTFGQTITTSGTGSFVTGITQTTNGFQVNLGTPPNTTYSTGSLAELNTGTVSTGRVWGANVLNQWLNAKGFSTQTLTAGTNISIVGNVISATNTNTTYSAGAGLTLSGTTFSLPITYSGTGNYVSDVTQTTNGLTVTRSTLPTFTDAITSISRNGFNIPIVNQNVNIPIFSTSGAGLVPARVGSVATKYLREDGTWVTPTNTTYSAGTLELLQAGTDATNRVWSALILAKRFNEINNRIVYYRDSNENIDSDVQWGTNIITGRGIQVQGGRNIVNGDYINVFGNRNISSGIHNQINGFVNVANGAFNTINGAYSSIAGSQANIIGNYLFARDKQTVLGMYNKVYDLGDDEGLRIAFGTGSNDFDKFNAVEIYDDHRTEFHGKAAYDEETRDPAWFTKDYTHVDTYQMGYDHLPHRASSSTSCEAGILRVAARVSSNFSSDDDRFTSLGDLKLTYNIHGIVDGNSIEDTINESRIHTKGTLEFSGPVTSILISNAKIDTNNLLIVRYNYEKNMMDMVGYVNSTMLTEFKSIPHIVTILLGSFILKQNEFGEPIAFFEFNQQIL